MCSEGSQHPSERHQPGVDSHTALCRSVTTVDQNELLRYIAESFGERHETYPDVAGPNSLFIRILLDKKYALPYKVVDGLVEHFVMLSNTYKGRKDLGQSEKLPVLWHQSLLVFAQRYVSYLSTCVDSL